MLIVRSTLRLKMHRILFLFISILVALPFSSFANDCGECCHASGGIQYCDSSAGRYVCSNGDYSSCYCTRHAVMDLQKIQGCCLWQGGVMKIDPSTGDVICNNGGTSEMCRTREPIKSVSLY